MPRPAPRVAFDLTIATLSLAGLATLVALLLVPPLLVALLLIPLLLASLGALAVLLIPEVLPSITTLLLAAIALALTTLVTLLTALTLALTLLVICHVDLLSLSADGLPGPGTELQQEFRVSYTVRPWVNS
jgi:hypothetical protein